MNDLLEKAKEISHTASRRWYLDPLNDKLRAANEAANDRVFALIDMEVRAMDARNATLPQPPRPVDLSKPGDFVDVLTGEPA